MGILTLLHTHKRTYSHLVLFVFLDYFALRPVDVWMMAQNRERKRVEEKNRKECEWLPVQLRRKKTERSSHHRRMNGKMYTYTCDM